MKGNMILEMYDKKHYGNWESAEAVGAVHELEVGRPGLCGATEFEALVLKFVDACNAVASRKVDIRVRHGWREINKH